MPNIERKSSKLLSFIYEERAPADGIGRGTHYSIIRLERGADIREPDKVRDISVIWDEDHDLRIMPVIKKLYAKGLLANVLFIGERKGSLTVLVDDSYFFGTSRYLLNRYLDRIAAEVSNVEGDSWQTVLGSFSPAGINARTNFEWIILAEENLVQSYLRAIGVRWKLGTKSPEPLSEPDVVWRETEQSPRVSSRETSAIPSWLVLENE